jgi:hypothetical protein
MLCCIGLIAGVVLSGMTGQIYYLPLLVGVGAAGDFLIFKNFKPMSSRKLSRFSCCGPEENKKNTNEQKTS